MEFFQHWIAGLCFHHLKWHFQSTFFCRMDQRGESTISKMRTVFLNTENWTVVRIVEQFDFLHFYVLAFPVCFFLETLAVNWMYFNLFSGSVFISYCSAFLCFYATPSLQIRMLFHCNRTQRLNIPSAVLKGKNTGITKSFFICLRHRIAPFWKFILKDNTCLFRAFSPFKKLKKKILNLDVHRYESPFF